MSRVERCHGRGSSFSATRFLGAARGLEVVILWIDVIFT